MAYSLETTEPRVSEINPRVARPSRLMARIYRDIGLAAVAGELGLPTAEFEPELSEAVKRGERYLYLMPKAERNPANG